MLKKALNKHEQEIFQEYLATATHSNDETERRYALLISVQWFTGWRMDELLNIKVRDLDPRSELIHIHIASKGSNARSSFVPALIIEYLISETGHLPHDAKIAEMIKGSRKHRAHQVAYARHFSDVNMRLFGVGNRRFSSHALRYTAAVNLWYLTDGNIYKVQNFLGHKSLTSTEVYLAEVLRGEIASDLRTKHYQKEIPGAILAVESTNEALPHVENNSEVLPASPLSTEDESYRSQR